MERFDFSLVWCGDNTDHGQKEEEEETNTIT
jgi:hypothetical protein